MSTVTGMTAEKVQELTGHAVVSASIDGTTNVLTLQTQDGQSISAGKVGDSTAQAIDKAWPVGSIFMSTVSTNPATLLGVGTWASWGTGRFPVGIDAAQTEFATIGQTGGEKAHVLSPEETPKHSHAIDHNHAPVTTSTSSDSHSHTLGFRYATNHQSGGSATAVFQIDGQVPNVSGGTGLNGTTSSDAHSHTVTVDLPNYTGSSSSVGGNPDGSTAAHNNLPPYITCYMWRRTS